MRSRLLLFCLLLASVGISCAQATGPGGVPGGPGSGGAPTGPAGGALTGTYPNPGTGALTNGTTATTQTTGDNTTKIATDQFVLSNSSALPSGTQGQPLVNTTGASTYATSQVYIDASKFTGAVAEQVNACVTAAIAIGGICDARALGEPNAASQGIATAVSTDVQITVGDSAGDPVTLLLPANFYWTGAMTDGTSCTLAQYPNTAIIGQGTPNGNAGAFGAANTSNLGYVYCTKPLASGASNYYYDFGFSIINYNNSGSHKGHATANNVGAFIQGPVYDESTWDNISFFDGMDTYTLEVYGVCCSAKISNSSINANYLGIPLYLVSNSSGSGSNVAVIFNNDSIVHNVAGSPVILAQDTGNHGGSLNFSNIYTEAYGGGSTGIYDFSGYSNVSLDSITFKAENSIGSVPVVYSSSTVNTSLTAKNLYFSNASGTFTYPITAISDAYSSTTAAAYTGTISGTAQLPWWSSNPLATGSQLVTDIGQSAGTLNLSTAISIWGDSLTQGNVDGLGDNYPSDLQAYTTRIAHNYGIGGQTSAQILTRFQNNPNSYNDYTVIWAGRNDISNSVPTATIEANLTSMVTLLPSGGRYVLMTILPRQDEPTGSTNANNIATVNSYITSTYTSNYLDIRSLLIADYNPSDGGDTLNHTNGLTPMTLRSVDQTTTLSAAITTTTQCPSITNAITLGVGTVIYIPSGPEYIIITGLSGNTISTCTRGYGTTAATYANGTALEVLDSLHLNGIGWTFVATQLNTWLNTNDKMANSHSPLFIGDLLNNTFIGNNAMAATASGAVYNVAFGNNALEVMTTGTANSAFGFSSLVADTTGYNNVAVGYQSLFSNTTGHSNVGVGLSALNFNTTGNNNTGVGPAALLNNSTGSNNTGVGNGALTAVTTNSNDTGVGYDALVAATGGSNSALGQFAGYYLVAGTSNTFVGAASGWTSATDAVISATNDTFVGQGAGPSSATQNNYLTIIGSGASYNCASCVVLGRATDTTNMGYIGTQANCSSSASPAVCGGAAAGSVTIAVAGTTVVVDTTAVTANSAIFVYPDASLGAKLGVTCNTTVAAYSATWISARTAGTSFTISDSGTIATNPNCYSYLVVN